MANNLKKFATEAEYSAATLNYPAVSWVTSGDTVHFDKSGATPTVNDKVMMAFTTGNGTACDGQDIVMYNNGMSIEPYPMAYFSAVTLNDVDVRDDLFNDGTLYNYTTRNTDYLAKYGISTTTIIDYFSGDLGGGWGSNPAFVDFLIPAQITEITHKPDNVLNLVIEATTPPTCSLDWSSGMAEEFGIYVPDASVNTYKSAGGWDDVAAKIYPISEYEGNLPV